MAEEIGLEPTHRINGERLSEPRQYHYAYSSKLVLVIGLEPMAYGL